MKPEEEARQHVDQLLEAVGLKVVYRVKTLDTRGVLNRGDHRHLLQHTITFLLTNICA